MKTIVHPRIVEWHPELSEEAVTEAWENYALAATRVPGERELRIGYDLHGRCLEMVGALTDEGWLIYHAMTPPSKKTMREASKARRRN